MDWLLKWPDRLDEDFVLEGSVKAGDLIARVLRYGEQALPDNCCNDVVRRHCEYLRIQWRFGKIPKDALSRFLTKVDANWQMTPSIWHIEKDGTGEVLCEYMMSGKQQILPDYDIVRTFVALGSARFRQGLTTLLTTGIITTGALRETIIQIADRSERYSLVADIIEVVCSMCWLRYRTSEPNETNLIVELEEKKRPLLAVICPNIHVLRFLVSGSLIDQDWLYRSLQLLLSKPRVIYCFSLLCSKMEFQDVVAHAAWKIAEDWANDTSYSFEAFLSASLILILSCATLYKNRALDASIAQRLERLNTAVVETRKRSVLAAVTHAYYMAKTNVLKKFALISGGSKASPTEGSEGFIETLETEADGELNKLVDRIECDKGEHGRNVEMWWDQNVGLPRRSGPLKLCNEETDLMFALSIICGAKESFMVTEAEVPQAIAEMGNCELYLELEGSAPPVKKCDVKNKSKVVIMERVSTAAGGLGSVATRLSGDYVHGDWEEAAVSLQLQSDLEFPGKALDISPAERVAITKETTIYDLPRLFTAMHKTLMQPCLCSETAVYCAHCKACAGVLNSLAVCGESILCGLLELFSNDVGQGIPPTDIINRLAECIALSLVCADRKFIRTLLHSEVLTALPFNAAIRFLGEPSRTLISKIALAEAINALSKTESDFLTDAPNSLSLPTFLLQLLRNLPVGGSSEHLLALSLIEATARLFNRYSSGLNSWQAVGDELLGVALSVKPEDNVEHKQFVLAAQRSVLYWLLDCSTKGKYALDIRRKLQCKNVLSQLLNAPAKHLCT